MNTCVFTSLKVVGGGRGSDGDGLSLAREIELARSTNRLNTSRSLDWH